jgi:hypothetical protein
MTMTPRRAAAIETEKARQWLKSCSIMLEAAENRLHRGADYPEKYNLIRDVEGAKLRRQQALEDWQGWKRLAARIR